MPKLEFAKNLWKVDNGAFDTVKYLTADKGSCTATLTVEKQHTNILEGLHGGFSATLVDAVSSFGLLSHDDAAKPSVSVTINVTYFKGAKIGDELYIESKANKVGRKLAFLEVEIYNKETMELLIKGSHVKCFVPAK